MNRSLRFLDKFNRGPLLQSDEAFPSLRWSGGLFLIWRYLLVDVLLIVEVKAEERIEKIFETQLNTYLRLSNLYLGLVLNFNTERLKDGGIKRIINPHSANNLDQIQHLL